MNWLIRVNLLRHNHVEFTVTEANAMAVKQYTPHGLLDSISWVDVLGIKRVFNWSHVLFVEAKELS